VFDHPTAWIYSIFHSSANATNATAGALCGERCKAEGGAPACIPFADADADHLFDHLQDFGVVPSLLDVELVQLPGGKLHLAWRDSSCTQALPNIPKDVRIPASLVGRLAVRFELVEERGPVTGRLKWSFLDVSNTTLPCLCARARQMHLLSGEFTDVPDDPASCRNECERLGGSTSCLQGHPNEDHALMYRLPLIFGKGVNMTAWIGRSAVPLLDDGTVGIEQRNRAWQDRNPGCDSLHTNWGDSGLTVDGGGSEDPSMCAHLSVGTTRKREDFTAWKYAECTQKKSCLCDMPHLLIGDEDRSKICPMYNCPMRLAERPAKNYLTTTECDGVTIYGLVQPRCEELCCRSRKCSESGPTGRSVSASSMGFACPGDKENAEKAEFTKPKGTPCLAHTGCNVVTCCNPLTCFDAYTGPGGKRERNTTNTFLASIGEFNECPVERDGMEVTKRNPLTNVRCARHGDECNWDEICCREGADGNFTSAIEGCCAGWPSEQAFDTLEWSGEKHLAHLASDCKRHCQEWNREKNDETDGTSSCVAISYHVGQLRCVGWQKCSRLVERTALNCPSKKIANDTTEDFHGWETYLLAEGYDETVKVTATSKYEGGQRVAINGQFCLEDVVRDGSGLLKCQTNSSTNPAECESVLQASRKAKAKVACVELLDSRPGGCKAGNTDPERDKVSRLFLYDSTRSLEQSCCVPTKDHALRLSLNLRLNLEECVTSTELWMPGAGSLSAQLQQAMKRIMLHDELLTLSAQTANKEGAKEAAIEAAGLTTTITQLTCDKCRATRAVTKGCVYNTKKWEEFKRPRMRHESVHVNVLLEANLTDFAHTSLVLWAVKREKDTQVPHLRHVLESHYHFTVGNGALNIPKQVRSPNPSLAQTSLRKVHQGEEGRVPIPVDAATGFASEHHVCALSNGEIQLCQDVGGRNVASIALGVSSNLDAGGVDVTV